jgi:exosortase D (VPLPA-CTERM-specific)
MKEQIKTVPELSREGKAPWLWILFAISFLLLLILYRDSLTILLTWWESPEYSHGYMIPVVALFLLWQRINDLPAVMQRGSWTGLGALIVGLAFYVLGVLSNTSTLAQYGFLLSIFGIALAFIGPQAMRLIWVVPFYLIFMIPLPGFFYTSLSSHMQLLSSEIGVAIIRLFGISVYLEGNVIDLGAMKLQVAEACSGMRYLFPLLSFGFLIAYLYRGPLWQRIFLFISTIPITILMNSFRIGVIGVTVDQWGIQMAQGFLHDFEGWVVFMGCVFILFTEIMLFHIFQSDRTKVLDKINLEVPRITVGLNDFNISLSRQKPFIMCFLLLTVLSPILLQMKVRTEIIPPRKSFSDFPITHNEWRGHVEPLNKEVLDILKLSDYLDANYISNSTDVPVNFYIAWYGSQRKGDGIHSPLLCIPGGGWQIEDLKPYSIPDTRHISGHPIEVNRLIIKKDGSAQLVYYWYEGRGRDIIDESTAKWFVLQDSMFDRHSDGALVRVVTIIPEGASVEVADQRLQKFLQDFYPLIPAYVP